MAKAKSKKNKNKDFQKIKLKVGRRLTKGDNITNLSFKTRQIQLTQTIRTGETSLPVTKRNLSIQDLLRQCEHHSIGARVNAISGIKELMLTSFDEFLVPSNVYGYGAIMKKISSILIDSDSDVRHSVINLFKLMFSKLKSRTDKLNADSLMSGNLFSHIHAYLCCAMNHIHEDVRLDALVLFDALLEAFPGAMVQQTGDLLKNLISMISAPISIGANGNMVAQRLSMNPDSKLPVMKFRARVLLRIKLTLQVALLEVTDQQTEVSKAAEDGQRVWSRFSDNLYSSSKQNSLLLPHQASQRFSWIMKGTASDMQDYIIKASSLEEYIQIAMPILMQCWKEARASGPNDTAPGSLLSSEALEVMSSVVGVIELLFMLSAEANSKSSHCDNKLKKVPTSLLTQNYETTFTQDFMAHFPYSALMENKPSKKKKSKGQAPSNNVPTESSLATLNASICHIMSYLCCQHSGHKDRSWIGKLERFLVTSFDLRPNAEHTRMLIKILQNFFHNASLIGNFSKVFEAAFNCYNDCKAKYAQKRDLFNFFSFVFKNWSRYRSSAQRYQGMEGHIALMEVKLRRFLKSLPGLSLRVRKSEVSEVQWLSDILSCISLSLTSPGNLSIADKFHAALLDLLDPKQEIVCVSMERVRRQAVSLLALCPPLNKEQLKLLLYIIRRPEGNPALSHRRSNSLACQAVTLVSLGIRRAIPLSNQEAFNQITTEQRENLTDYLKFMFSLLIGLNREEQESLVVADTIQIAPNFKNVCYRMAPGQWETHRDLVNIVGQELLSLHIPASPAEGYDHPFTFVNNIEQFWQHALTSYTILHVMSAYSLFRFINGCSLKHVCNKPSPALYETTASVIVNILVAFYLRETASSQLPHDVVEQLKTEIITCLGGAPSLLPLVCQRLQQTTSDETSSNGQQASVQATEFLMTHDGLKERITNEKLIKAALPQD